MFSEDVPRDRFPSNMRLLAGHSVIFAWYYAVFKALEKGDLGEVKMLYEAALTTTVCMRVTASLAEVAEASAKFSERMRQEGSVVVDNFVSFTDKIMLMYSDTKKNKKPELKDLQSKNLVFNGLPVNTSMLRTMISLNNALTREHRDLLQNIDHEYGREFLSMQYNKLRFLLQQTKNDPELIEWCLQAALASLRLKHYTPESFTTETFLNSKDGQPSWMKTALAQRTIVQHVVIITKQIEAVNAQLSSQLVERVIAPLANPLCYAEMFPAGSSTFAEENGDGDKEEAETQSKGDQFFDELEAKFPKGARLMADLLVKTYNSTYENDVYALCKLADPEKALVDLEGDGLGTLAKDIRELLRTLHAGEDIISSSHTSAPKVSLRQLVRSTSENGEGDQQVVQQEREDVWRRAVIQRRKYVTLTLVATKTRNAITEALKKAHPNFNGIVNESHRAIVLSGDLLGEKGSDPWLHSSDPPQHFPDLLQCLTSQRGPADVLLAFDGGNRTCRRKMEDAILPMPSSSEIFLTFDSPPSSWCSRKHPFSSRNTEVGYVVLPTSRTKISVRPRPAGGVGSAAGEDTSSFTSYTGITMVRRNRLKLISPEEKGKIFSDEVSPLPIKWRKRGPRGVPLFWCESKSVTAWEQILQDTMTQAVVDLSPGSGALAEACMKMGAQYFGIVFDKTHHQWLSNVVDRASLQYICEQGGVLYHSDLATTLKELFSDQMDKDDNDDGTGDLSDEDDAGGEELV